MPFTEHFDHARCEPLIYRRWEESGAFTADVSSSRPQFSISMPPPNATGVLHLGHAIMLALQDIMIRWKRMAGYEALWLPGTDHAAIATENVVIRKLQQEGIGDPRATLGREKLVGQIADYVEQSRATIRSQIRAMGASCDWTRERYTMDPQLSRCVAAMFARMFREGLIYRGKRVVNWDPGLQTTVADDEIEHIERQAAFYTIQYGPFLVGTSRPETKLGDTALAVHPDDERWKSYIGKSINVVWPRGPAITVKVVADAENVDPETGTGAIGVTPAHSQIDSEIARKHGLPIIQVIDESGRMTEAAGPYHGMTVAECRKQFVSDLKQAGLLVREETYMQQVSVCYRSRQPIEPLPKDQWFIDVNKPVVRWKNKLLSIKQTLRSVIEQDDIRIVPDHERKKYYEWIDKLHDWCISRQIWWGHRVPVWYRGTEDIYVGPNPPDGADWIQDSDTLDTWFSSALWTWSTLVDPNVAADPALDLMQLLDRSPDFKRFHPTSVMETGYDILFFWVARMILMTTYVLGDIPFQTIYLHGLILDSDGEKMTKSKPETCIDPMDVITEQGADALRMSLILGSTAGRDTRLAKEQMKASSRFINKIWNAAKLIHLSTKDKAVDTSSGIMAEHAVNRWMLYRVSSLIERVGNRLDAFSFSEACETIRESFWNEFCDFYLETIKLEDLARHRETAYVLLNVFDQYLRLCHPFIPFVTEQIWSEFGWPGLLIHAEWPKPDPQQYFSEETKGVDAVIRIVAAIRSLRAEAKIAPGTRVNAVLRPHGDGNIIAACKTVIEGLARVQDLTIDPTCNIQPGARIVIDPEFSVAVHMGEADLAAERTRRTRELELEQNRLKKLDLRLSDPAFLTRARPDAVESTRAEADRTRNTIAAIQDRLNSLGSPRMVK